MRKISAVLIALVVVPLACREQVQPPIDYGSGTQALSDMTCPATIYDDAGVNILNRQMCYNSSTVATGSVYNTAAAFTDDGLGFGYWNSFMQAFTPTTSFTPEVIYLNAKNLASDAGLQLPVTVEILPNTTRYCPSCQNIPDVTATPLATTTISPPAFGSGELPVTGWFSGASTLSANTLYYVYLSYQNVGADGGYTGYGEWQLSGANPIPNNPYYTYYYEGSGPYLVLTVGNALAVALYGN